jgi:hypothetical protein
MPSLLRPISLALCAAACAAVSTHGAPAAQQQLPPVVDTRPAEFTALLARYDAATGAEKVKLAAQVDAAAHQKYATVSRLYWHTDFDAARATARESKKPILHLRMLGNLAEDLSCANSRLFRATLYANQDVSAFLRDHFVLYWSSERPVPRVTIDYGDGRKIERTTTGNSAHYVMDADGHVLDVLPGLYAPTAFRKELTESLELAKLVDTVSATERARLVRLYHVQQLKEASDAGAKLAGTPYLRTARALITMQGAQAALDQAQRATVSKAAMEVPDLRTITAEIAPSQWPADELAMWASAGQLLYGIGDLKRVPDTSVRVDENRPPRATEPPAAPRVLDEQSLALVTRLYDAVAEVRATKDQRDAMIRRLEQNLVADSALNQLQLRPAISRAIMRIGGDDFAQLNAFVYAEVFRTPKADAWLGLLPRTDFTGLPGDGVVMH